MTSSTSEDWFVELIALVNDELRSDVVGLLRAAEKTDREKLVAACSQLCRRCAEHFALEESGGYLNESLRDAPQLQDRAEELLAEHSRLISEANALVAEAETGLPTEQWRADFRRYARRFVEDLARHEQAEDRLVQEALDRDVAAED